MTRDVYDRIGERIRARRDELGMTQADLAEQAGITTESLSRAERGVILPTVRTLGHLSRALRIDLVTLAEGEPARPRVAEEPLVYGSAELRRLQRLLLDLEDRSVHRLLGLARLLPRKKLR